MSEHVLYLVLAECPHCCEENRIVEKRPEPVGLMQDIEITRFYCTLCGNRVPAIWSGEDWDRREETEIERVSPTQEREADA